MVGGVADRVTRALHERIQSSPTPMEHRRTENPAVHETARARYASGPV